MQLRLKSTKLYTSLVGFPRTPRSTRITWRNRTKGRDFLDLGFELNIFLRDVMENIIKQDGDNTFSHNRPFYRYGGHIELIRLRSIMECPGGMSMIRFTRSAFTRAFRANFSLNFPKKDCNGKKRSLCRFCM